MKAMTNTIQTHTTIDYTFLVLVESDLNTPYEKITTKQFDNAYDAVKCYESHVDYGFAGFELKITLVEPNGSLRVKSFKPEGAQFENRVTRVQIN